MSNTISSVKERLYVVKESTWGTAVAPSNSNCVRFISCTITNSQPEMQRPDKNADEDEPIGVPGRRACTFTVSMSMAGSGTSATPPDCGPLLEAAMGHAVSGTTYALGGVIQSLSIWKYDQTGLAQCAIGSVVTSMKVALGGDFPTLEFSGEAYWGYDSAQAADGSTPSAAKGGLSSFPTEPSAPVTNGVPPQGFDCTCALDGNSFGTLLSTTIMLNTGRQLPKDGMNVYPTAPVTTVRTTSTDFGLKEDDSANTVTLVQKAASKVLIVSTFAVNGTVGTANIWTWTLKNQMLNAPSLDGSAPQRHISFNGTRAHPTSSGAYDSLGLVIT